MINNFVYSVRAVPKRSETPFALLEVETSIRNTEHWDLRTKIRKALNIRDLKTRGSVLIEEKSQ